MALATRPKPKVQHKKRAAKHHRQTKHYLRAYHPYLPVIGVLVLGFLANLAWPHSMTTGADITAENSTRIEAMTNNSSLALVVVIALAGSAFALYLALHWHRLQKVLIRGEKLIIKHPWLDVLLVAVFTSGAVLTRTTV